VCGLTLVFACDDSKHATVVSLYNFVSPLTFGEGSLFLFSKTARVSRLRRIGVFLLLIGAFI
jgi:hypothetical protein